MKRRRAASCDVVESTESGEQQSESGFWAKIHRRVHELLCPAVHELLRPAAVGIAARPSSLLPDRGSEAEDFARQACEAGDFSKTTALHALRLAKIPWNSSRKNVLPGDVPAVEGMICGLYVYGGTMGISTATQRSPWLVRLLAGLAQAEHPGFPFTSIQVNKNYAARPHVDKNNLGVSLILGLGDYSEGQLWVHDETGSVDLTVEEDITSSGRSYRKGRTYRGQELDIRDQWAVFDGNRLHAVRPFTGERFSLVFFTCGRVSQVPTQLQTALSTAGFNFDWSNPRLQEQLVEALEEKERSRRKLGEKRKHELLQQKELTLGHCQARTWNKGWGGCCSNLCAPDAGDFCAAHGRSWKTHGRIDGPIPEAKEKEMLKWQLALLERGLLPPAPLPAGAKLLVQC